MRNGITLKVHFFTNLKAFLCSLNKWRRTKIEMSSIGQVGTDQRDIDLEPDHRREEGEMRTDDSEPNHRQAVYQLLYCAELFFCSFVREMATRVELTEQLVFDLECVH